MSYQNIDISAYGGRPQELYRFALGDTVWRYTTGQAAISYIGENYAPMPLRRSAIEHTQDFGRSTVTLEVSSDFPLVRPFIVGPPDGALTLTVFRRHAGDSEFITYWKGRVISVVFSAPTAQLRCEPTFTALKRSGARAHYQIGCRHALYNGGCRINAADYRVAGVVQAVTNRSIAAAEFRTYSDGWFVGGRISAMGVQRMIISSSSDTIGLSAPIPGLAADMNFEAWPGCDHSLSTCATKFSNHLNHGGFPYIPLKNPFSGDAIV